MKRPLPLFSAITPILLTVLALISSVFYFKMPLYVPLIFGYFLSLLVALFYQNSFKKLIIDSYYGMKSVFLIMIIMVQIGILIAIWSSSGTIDALVYYGLTVIHPDYLVVISFLVSSIISMLLGTSVGTMSTIGVALLGIAHSLGINTSLVAGALVSGAFVGDRTSPLSSSAQMNAIVTKTNYHQNFRELTKTLIPAMILTTFIYLLFQNHLNQDTAQLVTTARTYVKATHPVINLWLLVPPLSILVLALFRVQTKINLVIGIIIGAVLAYYIQGLSINCLLQYGVFGYPHKNGTLYGGGLNMLNQVLLILIAGAFLGLLESSGILSTILKRMTDSITNSVTLVRNTMLISILSAVLSSTQVMAIIVPGKVLSQKYKEFDLEPKLLNRFISDSGMVVAGLIPWNLNAVLLAIALNISVLDYLPFAYLLMILPFYSFFQFSFKNYKRKKVTEGILPKTTNN